MTQSNRTLHIIGVLSGLAAGAWLGSAEAPTELATKGYSPFIISAVMVMGVFVARWTLPTLVKGTTYVIADLKRMLHLLIWAVIAGALWAVANTLTVFAVKNIGLAVAFPIWNCNTLVGILWGRLLFNELKGAGKTQWLKVAGGAVAIIIATTILGFASTKTSGGSMHNAIFGFIAALGAGLLWGTMYIPYRKAYISGMNPLSFVTVFTFGELGTVLVLSVWFLGGPGALVHQLIVAKSALFWIFLGGFCWVIGDIFQQFAAKYIGIGRGISLANTNQLWGVAWAALVFHDMDHVSAFTIFLVILGCLIMITGAGLISIAEASDNEHKHWKDAVEENVDVML